MLNVTMLQSFAGLFRAFSRAFRSNAMYQNLISIKLFCTSLSKSVGMKRQDCSTGPG